MKTTSDDYKNFSGSELNLLRTHMTTMKHHLRLKLLRNLLSRKLATRDIFFFTKSQADRRIIKKTQDWATTETAMTAKILDIKAVIHKSYNERDEARLQLLEEYQGKKFRLRRCIGRIKRFVQKERIKIWEKYSKKIIHYQKHQISNTQPGDLDSNKSYKKLHRPTTPPAALKDYSTLSIFGEAKDLPAAKTPLGPFICDSTIKLTKSEFA